MSGRFGGICFDLDGVLVDTMRLHARAWQDALRPWGVRVSRREIYAWEGESGVVTGGTLLARRGAEPSPGDLRAVLAAKERRFTRLARQVCLEPRTLRLVRRLTRQRVPLGLVTGTSFTEVKRIVPPDILSVFAAVVSGDQVRRGKPHPEPYRRAFRTLGIPGRRIIVVENAPYGIRSARQAGAGLVIALTTSLPQRYLIDADIIVASRRSLSRTLEEILPLD